MELKTQLKTAELLMKLLKGEEKEIHVLKGREEKQLQGKKKKNVLFERTNPENVGVSSKELLYFLKDMTENIEASLHEIMVLVDGKVILETAFSPYRKEDWHISHSLCKSVTNLAIGLLFTDGKIKLDEKITSIFSEKKIAFRGKMKRITVEHLLTMSSGIAFNEASSLFEEDWVKGCLSSGVLFEPGTKFFYNSLNSYLLSAIVVEKTGKGLVDYLEEKLFQKMGIINVFWEKCPKGIEKGGWGLSLTTEDVAKIGTLY
ncbi:MAG: serine hydrolase, partial [Clostridiales bacterium]|nr:serine hydrolase [Clostridiales bacterium]